MRNPWKVSAERHNLGHLVILWVKRDRETFHVQDGIYAILTHLHCNIADNSFSSRFGVVPNLNELCVSMLSRREIGGEGRCLRDR
jgi:hypothetical protein